MHTRTPKRLLGLAVALAAALPLGAQAHRAWLLPSSTVLSGPEPWVTVDAAVSNDLFYFEHQPMRLDGLVITAPDGRAAKPENASTGRYRSTFDLKLEQQGTYRVAVVNDLLMASFKAGGENRRLRGTAESLTRQIPADAQELSVTQNIGRTETYVSVGKPSDTVFKPSGRGIELVPVTHPNDLVVGDAATFRFLQDGKPAAGLAVSVVPGGIRFRSELGEQALTTDAQGEVKVTWKAPGSYWIGVTPPRPAPAGGGGDAAGADVAAPMGAPRPATGGTLASPLRRASYSLVVEVMPE